MDYLQYTGFLQLKSEIRSHSFKPYYKWITFNTEVMELPVGLKEMWVLNLIINGLPSILIKYKSISV